MKANEKNEITRMLAAGVPVETAAAKAGVSRRQAHRWLKEPSFQTALAEARPAVAGEIQAEAAAIVKLATRELTAFLASEDKFRSLDRARLSLQILRAVGGLAPAPGSKPAAEAEEEA